MPLSRSDSLIAFSDFSFPQTLERTDTLVARASGPDGWPVDGSSRPSASPLMDSHGVVPPLEIEEVIMTDAGDASAAEIGLDQPATAQAIQLEPPSVASLPKVTLTAPETAPDLVQLTHSDPRQQQTPAVPSSAAVFARPPLHPVSDQQPAATAFPHPTADRLSVPPATLGSHGAALEALAQHQQRQRAHQVLAEILNRWHVFRINCMAALHSLVVSNPRLAYQVFLAEEARNVVKPFEWDLDVNIQQAVASIYSRVSAFMTSELNTGSASGDATPFATVLTQCLQEKLGFVRQLVTYAMADNPNHLMALKESPVGYYLLPMLFDATKGIPEVACRILLQAGRFGDLGTVTDEVQQHWLERLRGEMREEKARLAAAAAAANPAIGLGLGMMHASHHEPQYAELHSEPVADGDTPMETSSSFLSSPSLLGIGSPVNIFVDPRALFPDGSEMAETGRPFRVFRTPNATLPNTPLLGLPFPSVADGAPTFNGYLHPGPMASLDPPSTPSLHYECDHEGHPGSSKAGEMQWELYEAPSRCLTPPPEHNLEPIADTQRRTMNSLSSATILKFSIAPGPEAVPPAPSPKKENKEREKEKPAKKKSKPPPLRPVGPGPEGDDEERQPTPTSPERKRPNGVVVQPLADPGYTIEEFSEAESWSTGADRYSDTDSDRETDGGLVGADGEYGGARARARKRQKKDRPRAPRAPRPPGTSHAKAPKKCEWCNTNHSPEWRKGPTGEKTLCNACGLKFARSKKSVAHYREFYAASNPPPFAGGGPETPEPTPDE